MRIDQFVPSLVRHDAIGNHVLQVRTALRSSGVDSDIFHDIVDPRLAREGRHYLQCDPNPARDRLILYHASTHSRMVSWIQDASANGQAVAIDYHNMTPAEYFWRWDPGVGEQMVEARQQLAALAKSSRFALADSEYNASELRQLGYADVTVAPLLLDLASYGARPNRIATASLSRRKARSGSWWLFVGRFAPNKCQHDVIAAFAMYRRQFDRQARLLLIGSPSPLNYRRALQRLATDLEVSDAVEFHGAMPFTRLLAYYRAADVFVCMSEHEGFCVPILEAMESGVPVVAFAAAAVGETVGGAGLLLRQKDPAFVAHEVHGMLSDADTRSEAVERGLIRARDFALASTTPRFLTALSGWSSETL